MKDGEQGEGGGRDGDGDDGDGGGGGVNVKIRFVCRPGKVAASWHPSTGQGRVGAGQAVRGHREA